MVPDAVERDTEIVEGIVMNNRERGWPGRQNGGITVVWRTVLPDTCRVSRKNDESR